MSDVQIAAVTTEHDRDGTEGISRPMSDPHASLVKLRAEIRELMGAITPAADLPAPDRFERHNQQKLGPEWHVWPSTPSIRRTVRVITGEPEVFVEGGPYQYDGDMEAITTQEARSFASALLAAADWADDVLRQRREQATKVRSS